MYQSTNLDPELKVNLKWPTILLLVNFFILREMGTFLLYLHSALIEQPMKRLHQSTWHPREKLLSLLSPLYFSIATRPKLEALFQLVLWCCCK